MDILDAEVFFLIEIIEKNADSAYIKFINSVTIHKSLNVAL